MYIHTCAYTHGSHVSMYTCTRIHTHIYILYVYIHYFNFGAFYFSIIAIIKDPDAGKNQQQEEKRATEDEMVGEHYQLNR